jgi:hypothetical protein
MLIIGDKYLKYLDYSFQYDISERFLANDCQGGSLMVLFNYDDRIRDLFQQQMQNQMSLYRPGHGLTGKVDIIILKTHFVGCYLRTYEVKDNIIKATFSVDYHKINDLHKRRKLKIQNILN